MFKKLRHGYKAVSMIKFQCFLICLISMVAWADDIRQDQVNNFLYGPYLNDAPIVVVPDKMPTLLGKKRCQKANLNRLKNEFYTPGLYFNDTSIAAMTNVARCTLERVPDAAVLLEKIVYTSMNVTETVTANRQLKALLYHPKFIYSVVRRQPQVLRVIPDSHPNYLAIVLRILPKRPQAFNYVTLRYKRHPQITDALFYAKTTYDDIYKHMAMQYTTDAKQRKVYAKHNGLLYLELPIEKRQDPILAYNAFVQNDFIRPFIPKNVRELFKSEGAYMVPRPMSKVVMARQALGRKVGAVLAPIKASMAGGDDITDPVDLEIAATDNVQVSGNVEVEEVVSLPEPVEFKNERTVVTDIRIINKIENKKDRRLLNLWRIARFGDNGQVFVAMFRPFGKENLGAIVIKQNERYLFSDYAAVFSMDGESIWRINDNGTFTSKSFVLDKVTKTAEGTWNFGFSWKGEETVNQFDLVDQGGMLVKEFVNYYFE